MMKAMTLNVRISGALREHVATATGETGDYENVSEYVRDLIRRDKERIETETFEHLKAELARAFGAPDESYTMLDAESLIRRNAKRDI